MEIEVKYVYQTKKQNRTHTNKMELVIEMISIIEMFSEKKNVIFPH